MIDYLGPLLSTFIEGLKRNDERTARKSAVISKLNNAIRCTLKHIEETNPEKLDNYDIRFSDVESKELSQMWSEAAEAIRPFDARLARTFEEKSSYWISPHGFIEDLRERKQNIDHRMNIDIVRQIARQLEYKWK